MVRPSTAIVRCESRNVRRRVCAATAGPTISGQAAARRARVTGSPSPNSALTAARASPTGTGSFSSPGTAERGPTAPATNRHDCDPAPSTFPSTHVHDASRPVPARAVCPRSSTRSAPRRAARAARQRGARPSSLNTSSRSRTGSSSVISMHSRCDASPQCQRRGSVVHLGRLGFGASRPSTGEMHVVAVRPHEGDPALSLLDAAGRAAPRVDGPASWASSRAPWEPVGLVLHVHSGIIPGERTGYGLVDQGCETFDEPSADPRNEARAGARQLLRRQPRGSRVAFRVAPPRSSTARCVDARSARSRPRAPSYRGARLTSRSSR